MSDTHMQRRQLVKAGLGLSAIALTSGCLENSLTRSVRPPALKVLDMNFLNVDRNAQRMQLRTAMRNQNFFALPINTALMGLQIAGVDMGKIGLPNPLNLGPGQEGVTDFIFETDLVRSIGQLGGIGKVGLETPIPYDLNGTLGVTSLNVNLPVRVSNNFTLAQLGGSAARLLGLPF